MVPTFQEWLIKKETTDIDLKKDIGDELSAVQQPGSQAVYTDPNIAGLIVRKLPKVAMALTDPKMPYAQQLAALQKKMPQAPAQAVPPVTSTPVR